MSAETDKKASEAVWEALSSLRLTIGILIILAVVSIFGTVIPQNASPEEYLRVYKFSTYRILHILGFLDMYRSWWFVFLLALLSLNLIACSAGRFRLTWRQVFSPRARLDDPEWGSLSPRKSLSLKGPPAAWVGPVRSGLAARFSPPKVIEEEGAAHFFAEKGKFSRLGVYFVHLGVLVILGGALIGFFYGFRGGVNLLEGETAGKLTLRNGRQVPFPGFQLKLERFTVSFYPTGAPQEFRSAVTLLEEGRAVRSESIRVNHPLTHRGLTFYQASYGVASLDKAVLAVREKSTGKEQILEVKLGARTEVPGSGYAFGVSRFFPDIQGMGPALQIVAMEPGRREETFFVLKNHPEMEDRRSGSYGFRIREIAPRYYSGLQVNKDPGVPLVWTGCILMVFGFYLAFFVSHRRLWGRLSPRGGDTLFEMAGSGHRNRSGFEEELGRVFQSFRKEILPPEGRSPERENQA